MKKNIFRCKNLVITIMVILVGVIAFGNMDAYAANRISINIDGEELYMDVPPVIIGGRTMVPLRAVSEAVGCQVDWFAEDQRIVVYSPAGGDPILVMSVNDRNVTRNYYNGDTGEITGEVVRIEAPPVIVNGRTMVPLRFIGESIGFEVDWDANSKTVFLYSGLYESNDFDNYYNENQGSFPEGVVYTEEYDIQGDPGDGLNAYDAALTLFSYVLTDTYDDYNDSQDPIYITLIGLENYEGQDCYIYQVKKAQYTSSIYAVNVSGGIYENYMVGDGF